LATPSAWFQTPERGLVIERAKQLVLLSTDSFGRHDRVNTFGELMNESDTQDSQNERGASLVEMAIMMPVLLMVFIGILELGVAFKDLLGASQAVREGVRIASFSGDSVDADCSVIEGMAPFLANYADTLDRVEIYRTNGAGQQIPSQTNVYTFSTGDITDCAAWNSTVLWDSTSRQTRVSAGPLDIIGVRVIIDRTWISQFPPFSGSYDIDETSISRLEPEAF
jgi:Flp pilus assembly protein TadG